jgi:UDP-2-acetamido-2,6-beta-L-arabino-hexul-4-ose reductase
MKSVLVTGASGFIGKNLCAQLNLTEGIKVIEYTKESTQQDLENGIKDADFIYHLAGVNRPVDEADFKKHNTGLTEEIISLLEKFNKKTPLLISSSTQAVLDNPYGLSKKAAEDAVFAWHKNSSAPVFVYRLPGVFGKWSKPNYNSVVATFCNNIANSLPISINDPSYVVTLAYIDDVVDAFIQHLSSSKEGGYDEVQTIETTFEVSLRELSERIQAIHDIRTSLIVPNLADKLNKYLYATYISYLGTDDFSYTLQKNSDQRGWLAEFVKSNYAGQVFISKTKPGISRGDHWHHTKIEKFLVVSGDAEITFRDKRDNSTKVIRYTVEGDEMKVLDIPVGYVHSIKNIGETDLVTLFWANELLDKERPDTYYEKVEE